MFSCSILYFKKRRLYVFVMQSSRREIINVEDGRTKNSQGNNITLLKVLITYLLLSEAYTVANLSKLSIKTADSMNMDVILVTLSIGFM